MRHTMPILAGLFLLCVALPAIAQKDYEPDSTWVDGDRWAVVKRMDINLFGIPVRAGGLSADARARNIDVDGRDKPGHDDRDHAWSASHEVET